MLLIRPHPAGMEELSSMSGICTAALNSKQASTVAWTVNYRRHSLDKVTNGRHTITVNCHCSTSPGLADRRSAGRLARVQTYAMSSSQEFARGSASPQLKLKPSLRHSLTTIVRVCDRLSAWACPRNISLLEPSISRGVHDVYRRRWRRSHGVPLLKLVMWA